MGCRVIQSRGSTVEDIQKDHDGEKLTMGKMQKRLDQTLREVFVDEFVAIFCTYETMSPLLHLEAVGPPGSCVNGCSRWWHGL